MEYSNLIRTGEADDFGIAISHLIKDNLKSIDTSFLAEVVSINGNKVAIKPLFKQNANDSELLLNNVLVAYPYSQIWRVQYKLKIGDVGVALVMQNDISSYKANGSGGVSATKRFKNANDSVFIPFSLYDTLTNDSINFIITNKSKCDFIFDNSENAFLNADNINIKALSDISEKGKNIDINASNLATLQGALLDIKTTQTSLKAKLGELAGLLEGLASGNTAPDGHGHASQTSPGSVGKFNEWLSGLDNLLK